MIGLVNLCVWANYFTTLGVMAPRFPLRTRTFMRPVWLWVPLSIRLRITLISSPVSIPECKSELQRVLLSIKRFFYLILIVQELNFIVQYFSHLYSAFY